MTMKNNFDIPILTFQNSEIEEVLVHKHLGLHLSADMKWTSHINNLQKKANQRLNLMKRLKFKLDRKSLETIYMSFIRPTLEYSDCVWAGTYENELSKLDAIQVDAMRIVSGAIARSKINNLYEELCWPTLSQRRVEHSLVMFYKILHDMVPQYLQDLMPQKVCDRTHHNLRSGQNVDTPFTRLDCYRRSFFPFAIREWNNLSNEAKSSNSLKDLGMKSILKINRIYYFTMETDGVTSIMLG